MNINKLKAIRIEKGYTQAQIASKMNITPKTYNRKELGIVCFTSNEILRISDILDLTLSDVNIVFFDNKLTVCIRKENKAS